MVAPDKTHSSEPRSTSHRPGSTAGDHSVHVGERESRPLISLLQGQVRTGVVKLLAVRRLTGPNDDHAVQLELDQPEMGIDGAWSCGLRIVEGTALLVEDVAIGSD